MSQRTDVDCVIRGGRVVLPDQVVTADIGIRDGSIVGVGAFGPAEREIDATGKIVLPGGIESHCHIEQISSYGLMGADDFGSGSIAAAFGGNTTIVPFACQHRGMRLGDVVSDYHERARKSVLDYGFHMIVTDPTPELLANDLAEAMRSGVRSLKVFLTYDLMMVGDEHVLDLFSICRAQGGIAMVHAENNGIIKWLGKRFLDAGHTSPRFHALSHPRMAEADAVRRAIALATLAGVPIMIVHVSCREALAAVREAREQGLPVFAETCPQYLFLTARDLDLPGMEGAKLCFSPPPRDEEDQAELWRALADGSLDVFSSDHAPYRMDETGKFAAGPRPPFNRIANGIPGIEVCRPLLFSEGVGKGRIDLVRFAALTAGEPARIYGLQGKGRIEAGFDADLAIWDPDRKVTIRASELHDRVGYSPYEGFEVTGWPTTVILRGNVVVSDGKLHARAGNGRFLPRPPVAIDPTEEALPELRLARDYGAEDIRAARAF